VFLFFLFLNLAFNALFLQVVKHGSATLAMLSGAARLAVAPVATFSLCLHLYFMRSTVSSFVGDANSSCF
jgi:hypothetical protein